jgi:hypothetical protein
VICKSIDLHPKNITGPYRFLNTIIESKKKPTLLNKKKEALAFV